jgi:nucleotide-binding universal stress UspA family protein
MSTPIRTIVTGVANLGEPDPCLAAAVALARRLGGELHAVHAYRVPEFLATFPVYEPVYQDLTGNYASELGVRLEGVLHEVAPGLPVHAHVVAGGAGFAVAEVAEEVDADLVVVGHSRGGALSRAILGTTAERVLREATRPVLLLREPLPASGGRVLVATDLSDEAAAVYEAGLDLAMALSGDGGLTVEALLVVAFGVVPPPLPNDSLLRAGEEELRSFLGRRRPREVAVEPKVRLGSTAESILAEARDWKADLLVVGTHGRSRIARYFIGSVAEAVLRGADRNVLVLPPAALRESDPAASGRSETVAAG